MKKIFSIAGVAVAAVLAFSSCQKADVAEPAVAESASFELFLNTGTKTVNDGLSTNWVAGDKIGVFHVLAGGTDYIKDGYFTIDNVANGHAEGNLKSALEEGTSYDWYIYYPYNNSVSTPANKGTYGYLNVGNKIQTQAGNNSMAHLAGDKMPLFASAKDIDDYSETLSITMHQVCSVVEIAVTNSTSEALAVSSVSFAAPEDIVGTYYLDITGENVAFTSSGDKYVSNTAVLNVSEAEPIAAGSSAKFYIALKPFKAAAGQSITIVVNAVDNAENTYSQKFVKTLSEAYEFKSGKIKAIALNADSMVPDKMLTVSEIVAQEDKTSITAAEALVTAVTAKGFVVSDGAKAIYVYSNAVPTVKIGDKITFSGLKETFNGVPEITSPKDIAVVSSGNAVTYPVASDITTTFDTYASAEAQYIAFTGTVSVSGNYYNVNVEGASTYTGSIVAPSNEIKAKITSGKEYVLTGYFNGITSSTYLNIIAVDVVQSSKPFISVTDPAAVAADVTSIEVPYMVQNAVDGKSLIVEIPEDAQSWVTSAQVSSGKITFSLLANTGSARNAVVTLKYDGAVDAAVKLSQSGAVSGSSEKIIVEWSENIGNVLPAGTQKAAGSFTFVVNGYNYTVKYGYGCYWINSSKALIIGKSVGDYIELPVVGGKKLTKVVLTAPSGASAKASVKIGTETADVADGKTLAVGAENEFVLYGTENDTAYRIILTSTNNVQISKWELIYE